MPFCHHSSSLVARAVGARVGLGVVASAVAVGSAVGTGCDQGRHAAENGSTANMLAGKMAVGCLCIFVIAFLSWSLAATCKCKRVIGQAALVSYEIGACEMA